MENNTLKKITEILISHDIEFWIADKNRIGIKAIDCKDMPDLITLIGSFLNEGLQIKTAGSLALFFVMEVSGVNLYWFYTEGNQICNSKVCLPKYKIRELILETRSLIKNL